MHLPEDGEHHVVIVGGGFGGLYAAKALGNKPVRVTFIDRRNYHLFQPLLYQVATGGLSPGDIATPLRAIVSRLKNIRVLQADVTDLDPSQQIVYLKDGQVSYDSLIIAAGVTHHYFGHDTWAPIAPGLKTIEGALDLRQRIFSAFERAETEEDTERLNAEMTFVIIGAGPTGVELAGALGELAHHTLINDFRHINTRDVKILLLEGADRVLPPYPPVLSERAAKSLDKLGVTVITGAKVTDIEDHIITYTDGEHTHQIQAATAIWAAGMKASALAHVLAERTGVALDVFGRVKVTEHLTVPGQTDILVIGDLAYREDPAGTPLPGICPVAMQQGGHAAKLILNRLKGKPTKAFRYFDKGSMAVIGRHAAVVNLGRLKFGGFPAWLTWIFIHIAYLIEFDNKLVVLVRWAWNYLTKKKGARLITNRIE